MKHNIIFSKSIQLFSWMSALTKNNCHNAKLIAIIVIYIKFDFAAP